MADNWKSRTKLRAFLGTLPGEVTPDSIAYSRSDNSGEKTEDLNVEPTTGKQLLDLEDSANGLIGDYLDYVVRTFADRHNEYPVGPGNREASPHNRGDPIPAASTTDAKTYTIDGTTLNTTLNRYSNSGWVANTDATKVLDDGTSSSIDSLRDVIDKRLGEQGHELLKSVEGTSLDTSGQVVPDPNPPENELLNELTDGVVSQRNRFNPSRFSGKVNPYKAEGGYDNATFESDDRLTIQRGFGDYKRNSTDEFSVNLAIDPLKEIAGSLMIKSTGLDTGVRPTSSFPPTTQKDAVTSDNPGTYQSSNIVDPGETVDGVVVGGGGVQVKKLQARYARGFPEIGSKSARDGSGQLADEDSRTSHGTVYTPHNKFDSLSQAAHITMASAALVTMGALAKTFYDDVVSTYDGPGARVGIGRGPLLKGAWGNDFSGNLATIKAVLFDGYTRFDLSACIDRGIKVLFNKIDSVQTLSAFANANALSDSYAVQDSPGYWLAVARSIVRNTNVTLGSVEDIADDYSNAGAAKGTMNNFFRELQKSKLLGFFRMVAMIGDISLQAGMGSSSTDMATRGNNLWNVDKLADGPATRVGKSRSGNGTSLGSLAWRNNSIPSAFLFPKGLLEATLDLGTGGSGVNPLKGMLATTLHDKVYLDRTKSGNSTRIPGDVVERLENTLDAEYVPFYFHDLRTNEIIAFHAFLSSLTDTFQPNYNSVPGYGRMDDIKIYKSTSRTIGLSFVVAATSQADFDEMWFKINKLVTLVYPQWSEGTEVFNIVDPKMKFKQPFSQVLRSSPMIRLRVGDVVKTNYSKFNLARMFGIGTGAANLKGADDGNIAGASLDLAGAVGGLSIGGMSLRDIQIELFYGMFGSPLQYLNIDALSGAQDRALRAAASQLLVNGFSNPILKDMVGNKMRDPDSATIRPPRNNTLASATGLDKLNDGLGGIGDAPRFGYKKGAVVFVKPNAAQSYYASGDTVTPLRIMRPLRAVVKGRLEEDSPLRGISNPHDTPERISKPGGTYSPGFIKSGKTYYEVAFTDLAAPTAIAGGLTSAVGGKGDKFLISHDDLILDPNYLFNLFMLPILSLGGAADALVDMVTNEAAVAAGVPADSLDFTTTDTAKFMSSHSNPVVKAFNSNRGRGLAGVVTRLNFKMIDQATTWETDWNSRAPKFLKIDMGFAPIHDLPPGLDHEGFNRAPIYNVGRAMEYISGDPYDDNGLSSKFGFRASGIAGARSAKIEEDE